MCGIAGAAGAPDINEKVKRRLVALGHRESNACGTSQVEGLSTGNILLKITGDMPQSLVGKGALIFDGDIFNFRELGTEQGIKSDSDIEMLSTLVEKKIKEGYSPINAVFSSLSGANGGYALAYALDNELVLARDPVGIKSLFYSLEKEAEKPIIFFASERKAFCGERSNIQPLPPGSIMSFNVWSGEVKEKFLGIEPPKERIVEEHEAAFRLKAALEKAVEIRLTKTTGIAFSGGIDSTFLAALAKRIDPSVPLYAVGLPNSHDLVQAEFAAEAAGMLDSLKIHLLSPEEIEAAIPDIIYSTESTDPMKIAIGLPLYFVAKTVKEDGKQALLTGQGADELFGGYSRYEGFFEQGLEVLDREIYSDLKQISTINLERDNMVTTANSVKLRVPFLDKEVIRTGLAIRPELKVLKRSDRYIRKYILRKAADSLLPPELLWKEKKAIQYGTGVQKVLDRLARDAGFSKKEGNHIEKYLKCVAADKGFNFIAK
ncbi:asparagine synthase (glutamine-hydrolysing) [Methanosarcina thermophila]|jgi:asparagine synthase (glutamine-hydrolysing)|uniref:Putative asparagine synthetase [glutamine-hydrolyzing] n=3 Tax=Methanosarcina thermophila TaxID=2210 RepID=A0A1I6Z898_METTE|nr:asparagine synthetase B [Methanosarcina thermophila]ALK06431.1 MAG: asparagine synthase [Methanosarcina sp. 795]AKB11915.1 Asparagine synthetase (glutamine-hydrolyzing) [Methanosarcina thermophila TM-1]AKB14888.1 Asparagine synthetase (glutamine-hydrolyzing) [Methanosarcina thermophila CHTI-55]NLU55916.1 asparagine synthetase B [Methanosarcina thermophila]SFT58888.1 asparagine synthase (glutamine-hydrolysing) [Methanosarcina thermophila]